MTSLPVYLDGWTLERVQARARVLDLSLVAYVELLVYQDEQTRARKARRAAAGQTKRCRNCGRERGKNQRDGYCIACYVYHLRHGQHRPEGLWNRAAPCWQCGAPRRRGSGGGGCCNSCYSKAHYRGRTAADLHHERNSQRALRSRATRQEAQSA
jgi:hypothetical protein